MVQEKLDQIVTLAQEAATELPTELQAKYDAGFTAGAEASGIDKIYSQVELDQRLADQASTYETTIGELNAQVSMFPTYLEQAKAEAVAAKIAELKAAYESQQVAEAQGETGFGALLS